MVSYKDNSLSIIINTLEKENKRLREENAFYKKHFKNITGDNEYKNYQILKDTIKGEDDND